MLDPPTCVRAVSAGGGMVIAGGDQMYLLRPGAQALATRPPPLDIGPVFVAAAEPRAPWRFAVASEDMVAVFFKSAQGEQILRLRPGEPGIMATHLAWALSGRVFTLYVRWDDGSIMRLHPDMSGGDPLDLPSIDAIAADQAGVLALTSFDPDEPRVFVTNDGETLLGREVSPEIALSADPRVHLAVADQSVAFSVGAGGAFLSRGQEAPFVACPPLAGAGPLAFEGTARDAALFGAVQGPAFASLIRADAAGAGTVIAELGNDAGESPELAALSWDSSRRMLWVASPEVGIFRCTAPSAKGKKKVQLS